MSLQIPELKLTPVLDPDFLPAVKWNEAFRALAAKTEGSAKFTIGLEQNENSISSFTTVSLPHQGEFVALNIKYVERLIKYLLWMKGGYKIYLAGNDALAADIAKIYAADGERVFDYDYMGERVYGKTMEIIACDEVPASKESTVPLGRNLEGCRIGFDLGGSDRKCAAVIDGKVVYSEEIAWNPYFESDPQYHIDGIQHSLELAAKHLPRVDAIGGSSAGVYVNSEVRAASLFRGVSDEDFEKSIRSVFFDLRDKWDVPFEVVNDGEVTALAGSMSADTNAVLGIAMGTSLAAGYVDPEGHITTWLNELAFSPIDYRENGPEDEWSGDIGCGVQYFSQQGVGRLIPLAGINEIPADMPLPEKLVEVQKLMANGDERARKIYETIGVCFGYAIAHYAEFYDISSLLILGRVTSGEGGEIIIEKAGEVLSAEYPALASKISLTTPNEKDKRHGQAVAAASLPKLAK